MKTSHFLLVVVPGTVLGLTTSGCFDGPGGIPGNHRGNDAPIVVTDTPTGLSSHTFDVTFTAFDSDSDEVILWDKCPNSAVEGATPILTVGYSVNGGTSFLPIDPADLELDGAALVVPTCSQVAHFSSDIRIAVATSGEQHSFSWNSVPYVPTAAGVTFRVAVNDGSFTSTPGDTDEFAVANQPGFSIEPEAARPGQTLLGAAISGLLTNWGGTTTISSSADLTFANVAFSSTTAGTLDVTMGPDLDQVPRDFEFVTPGAGVPTGDEHAGGIIWTCAQVGSSVVEFETAGIGGGAQPICDYGYNWGVTGDLTEGDDDFYAFVATSSGDSTFSLNWNSADPGDVTDYDAYVFDAATGLAACTDDLLGCACASVAKPESAPMVGMVAGHTYILRISYYAGAATDYTATIGTGP